MSLSQARVIDPVLTTHARGYKSTDRVGGVLFPTVDVTVRAGNVLEFGREGFILYNARRAPGADTKQIEFGYEGKPFNLVQDSLEGKVPREYADEAAAVPGIDLGLRSTNMVMNSLTLGLECEQAKIATDPANYEASHKKALSGTARWSSAEATPIDDIESARQVIRTACGLYPNALLLGPKVYAKLKNSKQIVDRYRNTDVITAAMLAALFEIDQVVEGKAVVANEKTDKFEDVWGNYAVLAYSPKQPNGAEEPSFGYTYTLKGNPYVEKPYWNPGKKSWVYGVTYERAPVLAGMSAGFLFSNVVE